MYVYINVANKYMVHFIQRRKYIKQNSQGRKNEVRYSLTKRFIDDIFEGRARCKFRIVTGEDSSNLSDRGTVTSNQAGCCRTSAGVKSLFCDPWPFFLTTHNSPVRLPVKWHGSNHGLKNNVYLFCLPSVTRKSTYAACRWNALNVYKSTSKCLFRS